MEETFLDSVSRWLGYIALTWVSYLIYLASGLSVTECVAALLNSKKTEAPHIQVIPATPSTPDKTFETFELPQASAESTSNATAMTKKAEPVEDILPEGGFVLDAPNRKPKNVEITDHPTDDVTSECTESFAAPETSAVAAAASATSAVLANAASIAPATQLCDPMCDPTTRFNVTRCSFSVEKLQTLPSIKILTPEDVCPPGTLISGLPESGNDDSSDSDPSPTNICRASDQHSTNLTDHHSPQRSNSDEGASPAGRRTGGDDLLVKMLCDIDQVEACHDLRKPRPSIDEPLLASDAAVTLFGFERQQQQADPQRRNHEKLNKQVSWDSGPGKAVRFSLPGSDTADCSDDSCSEGQDDDDDDGNFHESPDSDDEDSEGSPTTQRKTPSRGTPHATQLNAGSPLYESLLKDLSDETLDESTARIDTATVLDALLFQNKRRRSLPTVQTPGGDYEMVYREKLERQSLGDSLLTETSLTPQKFKASLKEEDFADLLPPLSPDCGYDSLSEVVSSPDEFDCYGSAQQLSVIVEEPLEEDKNPVLKKEAMIQNGNSTTTLAPAANLISTENAKHEAVDVKASSVLNRNHSLAPTEDFDSFTTVRL